jgi:diguanylate cyclase (GGDEF)-like protein
MNGCSLRPARLLAVLIALALVPAWAVARAVADEPAQPPPRVLEPGGQAAPSQAARLRDIERELRARPEEALRALDEVLPATGSVGRIEALVLRGWLQARLADPSALEQTAVELDAMSAQARTPGERRSTQPEDAQDAIATAPESLAGAAASLLRARGLARRGPQGRADRVLGEALVKLPPNAPAGLRLRIVETRAGVKQQLGKFEEAVALHQEAISLADGLGIDWLRAEQRSALAYTLFLAQQVERSAEVSHEAQALALQAKDPLAQFRTATMESFFAQAQGRTDDELKALRDAIALAHQAGAGREQVLALANLSDFYLQHGDHATALTVARKAVPLAREVQDPTVEIVAIGNAGLALILLGRHTEGVPMVQEALQIAERSGLLNQGLGLQEELGLTLEKAGLLQEAWRALVEHRRLSGDLFRREHQQAVLELQESFDAERRQRELALLETDRRLKEEQLLGRDLQHKLWALATASGVLVLAAVVLLLRRVRRSNAQLKSSNQLLQVATELDPLTGLANRRHFLATMRKIATDGVFEGSLLLIDIDHFKRINDEQGHAAGDAVLVELARRLRLALRPQDLTVRWGGEEFLIVVQAMPQDQVEAMAERLLSVIGGEPVGAGSRAIAVTASIGFATFPLEPARLPLPWERAIDLVDTAMYLAKAHGRNRAYGVRSLQAAAEDAPAEADSLESAWRAGRADLKTLRGPAAAEALT